MSATPESHLQFILLTGAAGFISLALFDLLQLTNRKRTRLFFSIIGYGGVAGSVLMQIILYEPAPAPASLKTLLIILAHGALLLLLYSLFLEIPLSEPFRQQKERQAIRHGTYGIVRHPGFLWFLAGELALWGLYREPEFALSALLLVIMNFLLVLLEDRVIFPRLLSNYEEYQKAVPLLIPFGKTNAREDTDS